MSSLPRNLFMFWDDPVFAERNLRCFVERWRRLNPAWHVQLLTSADITKLQLPEGFAKLAPQGQSDWVRLAILEEHGGVYVDATTLALKPLDSWLDRQKLAPQGYYFVANGRYQHACMSNWFIASQKGCNFIRTWRQRYEAAIAQGLEAYCGQLEADIKNTLSGWLPYLVPFAAWMETSKELCEQCVLWDPMAPDGPLTYTLQMAIDDQDDLQPRVAAAVCNLLPMHERGMAKQSLVAEDLDLMASRAAPLPPFLKFPRASKFLRDATEYEVMIKVACGSSVPRPSDSLDWYLVLQHAELMQETLLASLEVCLSRYASLVLAGHDHANGLFRVQYGSLRLTELPEDLNTCQDIILGCQSPVALKLTLLDEGSVVVLRALTSPSDEKLVEEFICKWCSGACSLGVTLLRTSCYESALAPRRQPHPGFTGT